MFVYLSFHVRNLFGVLPRCESTINFLLHFTMQSQTLQKSLPLGVEVNSEAYLCSILRTLEEYDCLT